MSEKEQEQEQNEAKNDSELTDETERFCELIKLPPPRAYPSPPRPYTEDELYQITHLAGDAFMFLELDKLMTAAAYVRPLVDEVKRLRAELAEYAGKLVIDLNNSQLVTFPHINEAIGSGHFLKTYPSPNVQDLLQQHEQESQGGANGNT
jgi:hypothetical protein